MLSGVVREQGIVDLGVPRSSRGSGTSKINDISLIAAEEIEVRVTAGVTAVPNFLAGATFPQLSSMTRHQAVTGNASAPTFKPFREVLSSLRAWPAIAPS